MRTISTQKVNCKDCHRCVRVCPVKAIGIQKGHASLVEEKCVLCGKCIVECPQQAKQVVNQLETIKVALREKRQVVLSLAPSFIAAFPDYAVEELMAALQGLGFAVIEETVVGAQVVSQKYSELMNTLDKTTISACCPVVVNLIEKYYPSLVDSLAPVLSPMMAHGKMLKRRYGKDVFVVFAGPCIAKMAETGNDGYVDAVITFEQLRGRLTTIIKPKTNKTMASTVPSSVRYYPIAGGILKSFMEFDATASDVIAVDGIEDCMQVLDALVRGEIKPRFVEALACSGGCINGPAIGINHSLPAKRARVIDFAQKGEVVSKLSLSQDDDFSRFHSAKPFAQSFPTEIEIRNILSQIGKFTKADEKNCGACGYNSCRNKAIAVYQGLAEIEMCVPYMRSKAESFANIIVDNSLNAIIVLNDKMVIQEFNPAAESMFATRKEVALGISLAQLIDCSEIIRATQSGVKVAGHRVEFPLYGLITEQMIIPLQEDGLIIVIFTDITEHEKRTKELQQMKLETVEKATEIINKQMQVAQEIAGLLGETTAETKSALLELIWLLKGKGDK